MNILTNPKQKRLLMYLMMIILVYVSWVSSFQKSISAINLNRQLKQSQREQILPDAGYGQLNRKHSFYQKVLKGYQVRTQDRENRLWQSVSGMAISSQVEIAYDKEKVNTDTDTLASMKGSTTDRFRFTGNYRRILSLLDTMEKSNGIGRLSELSIIKSKAETAEVKPGQLTVELTLSGILH